MSKRRELSQQTSNSQAQRYKRTIESRQDAPKPAPTVRIGDRDPVTGRDSVIHPSGSETTSGVRVFNASVPTGSFIEGLQGYGSDAIALNYKSFTPTPEKIEPPKKMFDIGSLQDSDRVFGSGLFGLARNSNLGTPYADLVKNRYKIGLTKQITLAALKNFKVFYAPLLELGLTYTTEEQQAILTFVNQGGGLFLQGERLPFAPSVNSLASLFGLSIAGDSLEDWTRIVSHPILDGRNGIVSQVRSTAFGAWTFQPESGAIAVMRGQVTGGQSVVVQAWGKGRIAFIGDVNAFSDFYEVSDFQNRAFWLNTFDWLYKKS